MVGLLAPDKVDKEMTVEVFHVICMVAISLAVAKCTTLEETLSLWISSRHRS